MFDCDLKFRCASSRERKRKIDRPSKGTARGRKPSGAQSRARLMQSGSPQGRKGCRTRCHGEGRTSRKAGCRDQRDTRSEGWRQRWPSFAFGQGVGAGFCDMPGFGRPELAARCAFFALGFKVPRNRCVRGFAIRRQQTRQLCNVDLGLLVDAFAVAERLKAIKAMIRAHA